MKFQLFISIITMHCLCLSMTEGYDYPKPGIPFEYPNTISEGEISHLGAHSNQHDYPIQHQGVDIKSTEIALEQFLNRDNQLIYRHGSESTKHFDLTKDGVSEITPNAVSYSGRRLAPYTETIADSGYFL